MTTQPTPSPVSTEDVFPIMNWDEPQMEKERTVEVLRSLSECNFTVAGFFPPDKMPACDELGLKAMVAIPGGPQGTKDDWAAYSDAKIERLVADCLAACGNSKAPLGLYVVDEPIEKSYENIGRAVSIVRRLAPDLIAYVNLFGNEVVSKMGHDLGVRTYPEYLERMVKDINPSILSWDNYNIPYSGDQQDREEAAWYYDNLLMAREFAQKKDLPFWNTITCVTNHKRASEAVPSLANMGLQAFTSLAAGANGIAWYTFLAPLWGHYWNAPFTKDGRQTLTWFFLREINRQVKMLGPILNKAESTGVYFSGPMPSELCSPLPGRLVKAARPDTPLMIGEFEGEHADYVMVVNLCLDRTIRFKLTFHHPADVNIISSADGERYPMVKRNDEWLTAGQAALLEIPKP